MKNFSYLFKGNNSTESKITVYGIIVLQKIQGRADRGNL